MARHVRQHADKRSQRRNLPQAQERRDEPRRRGRRLRTSVEDAREHPRRFERNDRNQEPREPQERRERPRPRVRWPPEPTALQLRAEALLAHGRNLWSAAARAESVTTERLRSLSFAAMTPKLDGSRALVIYAKDEVPQALRSGRRAATRLPRHTPWSRGGLVVLDAEEDGAGRFHVFDALAVDDVDVRPLPLHMRLDRLVRFGLPSDHMMKPYVYSSGASDAPTVAAQLLAELRSSHDGLIILDPCGSYESATPYKYKPRITCDFVVEAAQGALRLLYGTAETLEVLREGDKEVLLRPPHETLCALGLERRRPAREHGVVVECAREDGHWNLLRRRPDRRMPNSEIVVRENMALERAGCHLPAWLLGALPAWSSEQALHAHLQLCRRAVAFAAGDAQLLFFPQDVLAALEEAKSGGARSVAGLFWNVASPDVLAALLAGRMGVAPELLELLGAPTRAVDEIELLRACERLEFRYVAVDLPLPVPELGIASPELRQARGLVAPFMLAR
jgi:hypothetical protein